MASRPRPSRAFRISDRRHEIFDGMGAYLNGARWNSPGRRIIYAAETFSGAMLEILAHTRTGKMPRTHAWIEIEIPPEASAENVEPEDLPGWDAEDAGHARSFGDRWYREQRSLILIVPSVVSRGLERNLLINQDHPELRLLRPGPPRELLWDTRLVTR